MGLVVAVAMVSAMGRLSLFSMWGSLWQAACELLLEALVRRVLLTMMNLTWFEVVKCFERTVRNLGAASIMLMAFVVRLLKILL